MLFLVSPAVFQPVFPYPLPLPIVTFVLNYAADDEYKKGNAAGRCQFWQDTVKEAGRRSDQEGSKKQQEGILGKLANKFLQYISHSFIFRGFCIRFAAVSGYFIAVVGDGVTWNHNVGSILCLVSPDTPVGMVMPLTSK